jgi:hypothetical protein
MVLRQRANEATINLLHRPAFGLALFDAPFDGVRLPADDGDVHPVFLVKQAEIDLVDVITCAASRTVTA